MTAPVSMSEKDRLNSLWKYGILDTPPEPAYDDIAFLAAQICQVPIAFISLVDGDRQWFKARIGVDLPQTPRSSSFCTYAIETPDEVLEVGDTQTDARFAGSEPARTWPLVRFYAGAPMVAADGGAIGAVCVMDLVPRRLNAEQVKALKALGRAVVSQLETRRHATAFNAEVERRRTADALVHSQLQELRAIQLEAKSLLDLGERSRKALLSILEDEQRSGRNLRESEERFRQVVETIQEVFWLRDMHSDRFIYVSPRFETIWGRKCEEIYRSPHIWLESIVAEDRTRVTAAIRGGNDGIEHDETFRILRPDGTTRWIRSQAFSVRDPKAPGRRSVGVAADVTERKKLEEQFLHAQRMEAIGTLASGVAHDLNNILAPMLMVAGLLQDSVTKPADLELLDLIERSGKRGAAIVQQLLTFSRGLAGERVSVQLKHIVREMVAIMNETFPRNITVVDRIPKDLWTVEADATQMHQVIMNLCVNARDAMPSGGVLTLDGANLSGREATAADPSLKPKPHVLIIVRDTGEGISPEIIERIFDPFFTTKGVGKGTGLGLSTVTGIIKDHGGAVGVSSEPGRGTVFRIYLPASLKAEFAAVSAPRPMPRGKGEVVLIVDDEAAIRVSTTRLLEHHGYRVLDATSGEDAVKLFIANRAAVRLVITDIMMPGMDGLALLRTLQLLKPGLQAIATSGLDTEVSTEDCAALGLVATLRKPVAPDGLLRSVALALAT
jgi:two-component system cell cycle sensor histidine kinase/response regulator CckA